MTKCEQFLLKLRIGILSPGNTTSDPGIELRRQNSGLDTTDALKDMITERDRVNNGLKFQPRTIWREIFNPFMSSGVSRAARTKTSL